MRNRYLYIFVRKQPFFNWTRKINFKKKKKKTHYDRMVTFPHSLLPHSVSLLSVTLTNLMAKKTKFKRKFWRISSFFWEGFILRNKNDDQLIWMFLREFKFHWISNEFYFIQVLMDLTDRRFNTILIALTNANMKSYHPL